MSTMAVASGARSSSLNPNAPLFIPASFQQVEDFSPEWWVLVKTTSWFRELWFRQHQEQETFDGDEEEQDVANLLPDSFDLGIDEDFAHFQEQEAFRDHAEVESELLQAAPTKKNVYSGLDSDAQELIKSLSLKSTKSTPAKLNAKTKEKPVQVVSPKFSPRRIIQQPR